MKYFAPIWVCALFIALALPSTGEAYFTTNQEAFSINNTVGVFVIDFSFGHEKYDVHIPVAALRTSQHSDSAVSFDILNGVGTSGVSPAVGIVLSDAKLVDGEYIVPKGTSQPFRLLVLYSKAPTDTAAEFRAAVTHLPFSFDGTQDLKLNSSELQYYKTGLVSLSTYAKISAPTK